MIIPSVTEDYDVMKVSTCKPGLEFRQPGLADIKTKSSGPAGKFRPMQDSNPYTPHHLACAIVRSQAGREIGPTCHASAAAKSMGYLVLTTLHGTKQRLAIVADSGGHKRIR